jgi:hypothetical protein
MSTRAGAFVDGRLHVKNRALLVLLSTFLLSACAPGAPRISLAQSHAELGEVTNGEVRSLVIGLSNAGERDLVIESVTTSCGCTTASVEPAVIPPGGSGQLTIQYDSGAHGPDFTGEATRQVFIDTNDPDESEVVFTFSATVVAP